MCNVIKIQSAPKNFQLKISSGIEDIYSNIISDEEKHAEQLKAEYEKGYNDALSELELKYKNDYEKKMGNEQQKLDSLLNSVNEELKHYESKFSEMVITTALAMSKKILHHEVDKQSPLLENIRSVAQKIIGANYMVIKSNPEEIKNIKENSSNLFAERGFSKIKIEEDARIEKGSFIVESDIGNIDGQISSQLNEIKKVIGNLSNIVEK